MEPWVLCVVPDNTARELSGSRALDTLKSAERQPPTLALYHAKEALSFDLIASPSFPAFICKYYKNRAVFWRARHYLD
jgi:hypothetical protein